MTTDYNKLKVAELKAELKRLGLPQNGLKADLVARLEAAASDGPASGNEAAPATEDDDERPKDSEELVAPVASEVEPQSIAEPQLGTEIATEPQEILQPDTQEIDVVLPNNSELKAAAASVIDSGLDTAQTSMPLSSSSVTPLPTVEIVKDSQKRKRRSVSPLPTAEDVAAKRARVNDDPTEAEISIAETNNNKEAPQASDTTPDEPTDISMGDLQSENTAGDKVGLEGLRETMTEHVSDLPPPNSDEAGQAMADDSRQQSILNNDTAMGDSFIDTQRSEELELDVEPSVHPATSALYIKNFMRPLRPQAVKDHLLDLATPTGVDIDDQTIPEFYLDNIRTHSFVLFSSVTAAKRVRNALHNRIWPDETNRKPLWIDYIPADRYHDWVDMERSAGSDRGSSGRYEIVYNQGHDGRVTAELGESGAAPPATTSAPPLERRQSIPTGPSRGMTGIEGAPTGPRGFQGGRPQPQPHSSRGERVGDYKSTATRPSIAYQPVSEELARRRLDAMRQVKSRDYDQQADKNKEYRRYFFENGDLLVDRGPEIFLGIRPPHRERERRNEHDRDDRRRGGRGRRNGRRGMPTPHGVPRGGDRYRGPAASSVDYDNRPRYDDRGGERYRGKGYGRH